jgi:hypothetical protein
MRDVAKPAVWRLGNRDAKALRLGQLVKSGNFRPLEVDPSFNGSWMADCLGTRLPLDWHHLTSEAPPSFPGEVEAAQDEGIEHAVRCHNPIADAS